MQCELDICLSGVWSNVANEGRQVAQQRLVLWGVCLDEGHHSLGFDLVQRRDQVR
ncbi:hypothetical protein AGR7B_pAt0211 [Agrobacterium deltaense RV3]|nr:hypothetical protein AGR7B_pAt0211 [Agrobacterium deltaense RV3]